MAVVVWSTGSVAAVTTGDVTVTLPNHQTDDILVVSLVGWVPNTNAGTAVIAAPSGWSKALNITQETGGVIDGEFAVFWKRATSNAETNPTFARPAQWDVGTDTCLAARAINIRGCVRTGTPWDDIEVSALHTAANGTWPSVTVGTPPPDRFAVAFYLASNINLIGTVPSGWTQGASQTTTQGTDASFNYAYKEVSATTSVETSGVAAAATPYVFFVASFVPANVNATATGSFVFSSSASGVKDSVGLINTVFGFSGPVVKEPIAGLAYTESTVLPDRVGAKPAASFSATHTVLSGTSSLVSGSGSVLAGDYGFRGLYTYDTTTDMPGDFDNDARGYVNLAEFGDFKLRTRRKVGTVYEVRAEFTTAAAQSAYVSSFINVDNDTPTTIGLAVTRVQSTGEITLWRSNDGWQTWFAMPISTSSEPSGALPDSVGDSLTALSGDLRDGAWLTVFKMQWAESASIANFDATEAGAWNYGSNIVTGLGGNFYDAIDSTVKSLVERAANSSYVYSMRSESTYGSKSLRVDMTVNAASNATSVPPSGTASAFSYDTVQQLENGPADSSSIPPVLFQSDTQFSVAGALIGENVSTTGFGTYTADGQRPRYRVQLVDQSGVPSAVLDNAVVTSVVWSLNEAESFSFTLPTLDANNDEITIPDQEVQVWRGDQLLVWGVPVRSIAQADLVEYQCKGLAWFFTKRVVGREAQNYIQNGSFEAGAAYWYVGSFAPTEPTANRNPAYWDANISSSRSVKGTPGRSLYQSSTNQMTFGVRSIQFFFHTINPANDPEGITWTASAWVYVPSAQWSDERNCAYTWNGDSAPMGLSIVRMSTTEFQPDTPGGITVPKVLEHKMEPIGKDIPKDEWVRLEVSLVQPNEGSVRTDWMQVELATPIGAVYWDEVRLVRNERLYYNDVDQVTIMHSLVQHAQSTAFGKSNLNIGVAGGLSGIKRTRTYEFFNHELISDSLTEFTQLWKGVDWSINVTPTTRTFQTYFPMKGTRRPSHPLILGKNIASISIPVDGEQVANRVIVMADNGATGQSREEAYATDTSGFDSGVVLEYAYNAVKDSPIATIEDQAQRGLRQYRVPVVIPTLTTYENLGSELLGALSVGDVVPVKASVGSVEVDGEYRIMQITLEPDSENLQIVVNPFEEWNDPTRTWGVIT